MGILVWGTVTIVYPPTGYSQAYARKQVMTDEQAKAMADAAAAHSAAKLKVPVADLQKVDIRKQSISFPESGSEYI